VPGWSGDKSIDIEVRMGRSGRLARGRLVMGSVVVGVQDQVRSGMARRRASAVRN
jgi:hypothetical protein